MPFSDDEDSDIDDPDTWRAMGIKPRAEDDEERRDRKWMKDYNLSEPQLDELKESFSLFDKDDEGFIPVDSFGDALRATGQCPTISEIEDLRERCSLGENNLIGLDEFVRVVGTAGLQDDLQLQERFQDALKVFDTDNSGYLDADKLRHALKNLGEPLDDDDISEMIALVGVDDDNRINYFDLMRSVTAKM